MPENRDVSTPARGGVLRRSSPLFAATRGYQRGKATTEMCRCALSAYDYRIEKAGGPHARLNRALVLFLLGRRTLAEEEVKSVGREQADPLLAQFASRLLKSIDEAAAGDPWSILGLD